MLNLFLIVLIHDLNKARICRINCTELQYGIKFLQAFLHFHMHVNARTRTRTRTLIVSHDFPPIKDDFLAIFEH